MKLYKKNCNYPYMSQRGFTKAADEIYKKVTNTVAEYAHPQITLDHVLKEIVSLLSVSQEEKNKITYEVMNKLRLQPTTTAKSTPSREFVDFIKEADKIADSYGDKYISVDHFILSLIQSHKGNEAFNKLKAQIKEDIIRNKRPADSQTADDRSAQIPAFATDMVAQARSGKFDPVIGRDEQIRSVIEILSKREKCNPILIGNPGVGKTAIVNEIANEIANNRLPTLKDCVIYNVDIGSIVAGTGVRGEFEERFKKILKEAAENPNVILFIDEIHMLINAGSCQGTMDAANMLKPQLANGDIKCIGATTFYEYRKYIESDPAFARRFVKVDVNEPSIDDSITMLRGLKERIEMHHGTRIEDSALVASVKMAKKYIPARMLPDSAIDLIDTACAAAVISVESDTAEILKIKGKMWSLGLEKASLEHDLKRKIDSANEKTEENNKKSKGSVETKAEDKMVENVTSDEIEKVKERIKIIQDEINNKQIMLEPLEQMSAAKKQNIEEVRNLKQKIEQYKIKLNNAEINKEFYEAAEIQNHILPNLQEKLKKQQMNVTTEITPLQIAEVISRWTGVPVSRLTLEENERLLCMYDRIKSKIFGQNEAVETVVDALLTNRAGISDQNKPIGCFLFLGPTGVGKTELAKAICYEMFDNEKSVVIDMSDYSTDISVSKLIGVSAGYVGYGEGGKLTEPVKNKPYSVVLLDEIDLAHPSVYNIMYQLLDEGRIVDGKGTEVDFRNCVIIMTSNLGYKDSTGDGSVLCRERAEKIAINKFGPALYNRIDSVVHFNPLGYEVLSNILDYQIGKLNQRLAEQNMEINFSHLAKSKILKSCCSVEFGARPLKKYLQKVFVAKAAKFLLRKQDQKKLTIMSVDLDGDDLDTSNFKYQVEEY